MIYKFFTSFVLLVLLHSQVQAAFRISGTVEETNGLPVKGAHVALLHTNIVTNTDTLGHFNLIPTAINQVKHYNKPHINAIINGKALVITLARATNVVATVFDLKGRCIAKPVNAFLSEGKHTFLLDKQVIRSGKHIVSLTTGDENKHYIVSSSGLKNIPQSTNPYAGIAKTLIVDTLEISFPNYITRKVPIISDTILNIKIARRDTVSTGVTIEFTNALQCNAPVYYMLHISGDLIDTTLQSTTFYDTLWPTLPLDECVDFLINVFGANGEQIAEGHTKRCPAGSNQIITIPSKTSINAIINQIPIIHSATTESIEGRIESGFPISNLTFSILDSNGMDLQNSDITVKWNTISFCGFAELKDLKVEIVTQPSICQGKYNLKMVIQAPDTTVTISEPFTVEGIACTAVIKDSAILGSNQNAIYGCSIDLDKNKVFLAAEARMNVHDIDLCYAYSGANTIEKIFTPYETYIALFDFSRDWVNPPKTKFLRLDNCDFDAVTTAEQIEALWNDSQARTTSFIVSPDDVFIVNTTEGHYVLIRIKQMQSGSTGWIRFNIARRKE